MSEKVHPQALLWYNINAVDGILEPKYSSTYHLHNTHLTNFATLLTVDLETFWLLTLMMKSPAFSPASSAGDAVDTIKKSKCLLTENNT